MATKKNSAKKKTISKKVQKPAARMAKLPAKKKTAAKRVSKRKSTAN